MRAIAEFIATTGPSCALGLQLLFSSPSWPCLLLRKAASDSDVIHGQVIQLAHHYGFKTINLVRRREQVKEIIEAGCDPLTVIASVFADAVKGAHTCAACLTPT